MFYSARQQQLLSLLQKERSLSVHRLSRLLCISESSVRRDLAALEEMGKIKRTFGGAVFLESADKEVSLLYRETQYVQEKKAIAQKAAEYVQDGMTLFLDASSTAAMLLPFLQGRSHLTVVTNSPLISLSLSEANIRCYCTGGLLLKHSRAFVGDAAVQMIGNMSADLMLFSCRGLSEDGILSDSLEEEVVVRRAMLKNAKKKIFLCNSAKRGASYPFRLCRLEDLDGMISEEDE